MSKRMDIEPVIVGKGSKCKCGHVFETASGAYRSLISVEIVRCVNCSGDD